MPRVARFIAVAAFGAALAFAPAVAGAPASVATASTADVNDFTFESFNSDYLLTRDPEGHAQLQVVETIVAIFPDFDQNRGFYRDIPEYRHGVQLHTSVASVVDESGQPVPYTTEYYQDFFSVGLGDDSYVHGRQTYVITYSQVDVVEAFTTSDLGETVDEFYWDVNGTGWAQPFGRVSMTLRVDPSIAPALTRAAQCYVFVGDCDEPITGAVDADGAAVFTAASNDLGPNDSLTFAIAFAPGTFTPGEMVVPPPTEEEGDDDYPYEDEYSAPSFWDTATPFVLAGVGTLTSWIAGGTQTANRTRRTGPSDIIIPQYTPPKDLNVMVAAYVAGASDRAFAAQIVSLAVRGNLRLLDHPADSSAPFEVELLNSDGLDDLETKLVHAIFGADPEVGRRVALGPSNMTLGGKLISVYTAVDKSLRSSHLLGPAGTTTLWKVLFGISLVAAAAAGIFALASLSNGGSFELALIAAGVAFFAAVSTYGKQSTVATLSDAGRAQNDYLLGMRDYMQLAEEDRIRVLQSPEGAERVDVDDKTQLVKLYERLLPYAVIFGIEEDWAKELTVKAVAANVPVVWWSGSSDFTSWRLNSTLQNLRHSTPAPPRPILTKPPGTRGGGSGGGGSFFGGWSSGSSSGGWSHSSGSSFSGGSSGGGFSGGGGGGGGGRGR